MLLCGCRALKSKSLFMKLFYAKAGLIRRPFGMRCLANIALGENLTTVVYATRSQQQGESLVNGGLSLQ